MNKAVKLLIIIYDWCKMITMLMSFIAAWYVINNYMLPDMNSKHQWVIGLIFTITILGYIIKESELIESSKTIFKKLNPGIYKGEKEHGQN